LFSHPLDQAQQHRHVDIVAAGMHQSGVLGGKRAAGAFRDRQGIHVRAKQPVRAFATAVFHQNAVIG